MTKYKCKSKPKCFIHLVLDPVKGTIKMWYEVEGCVMNYETVALASNL